MKTLFTIISIFLCSVVAMGQEVVIDHIKYTIGDDGNACARQSVNMDITEANIPSNVVINGKNYTVTSIGYYAFGGCKELTSFTMPNTITLIDATAFMYCPNLETVTFSKNLKEIGDAAFSSCAKLKEVILPSTLSSIGDYAFYGCYGLRAVTIPTSNVAMGDSPFLECLLKRDLVHSSIDLSKQGASIYEYITSDGMYIDGTSIVKCESNVTRVLIPNGITHIMAYSFRGCSRLESISFPSSVVSIGNNAFESCTTLTSLRIPSTIKEIGYDAFTGCYFENDSVSDGGFDLGCWHVERHRKDGLVIDNKSLMACAPAVEHVVVPEGVEHIRQYAFNRTDMKTLCLPSTLIQMEERAVHYCHNIETIVIPPNMIVFSTNMFLNNNNLRRIVLKGRNTEGLMFSGGDFWTSDNYDISVETLVPEDSYAQYKNLYYFPHIGVGTYINEDINYDGKVNSSDVVGIYNYIINADASGRVVWEADVNGDGLVNSADVIKIYNRIINGK